LAHGAGQGRATRGSRLAGADSRDRRISLRQRVQHRFQPARRLSAWRLCRKISRLRPVRRYLWMPRLLIWTRRVAGGLGLVASSDSYWPQPITAGWLAGTAKVVASALLIALTRSMLSLRLWSVLPVTLVCPTIRHWWFLSTGLSSASAITL